jgi:hypothetical protein
MKKIILLPILCALSATPLLATKKQPLAIISPKNSSEEMYQQKKVLQKVARYSKNTANVLLGTSALTTLALLIRIKQRSISSKISFLDFLHVMGTKALVPIGVIEALLLYGSHIFRRAAKISKTELTFLERKLKEEAATKHV